VIDLLLLLSIDPSAVDRSLCCWSIPLLSIDLSLAAAVDDTIDLLVVVVAAAVDRSLCYRLISLLSIDLSAVDRSITCYCCLLSIGLSLSIAAAAVDRSLCCR
jgi:hypothetical protein